MAAVIDDLVNSATTHAQNMEFVLMMLQTLNLSPVDWSSSLPIADLRRVAHDLGWLGVGRADIVMSAVAHQSVGLRYYNLWNQWGKQCRELYNKLVKTWIDATDLLGAMVHVVQEESGSGVRISDSLILTCAHCIISPDDPDDEDCQLEPPNRVGRVKVLLLGSGEWCLAECVKADDKIDLALLQILTPIRQSVSYPSIGPSDCKASPVLCVGNPCEFDLEADDPNATITFTPPIFHTSKGRLTGPTNPTRCVDLGLGKSRHTAWTYWGHSGAPLINRHGQIVGIHNSWDEDRGTRHCVSSAEIAEFVGSE
eukprot:scaffold2560_cov35-Attheya_sp.AAC.3